MNRIVVFGAGGRLGRAVVAEALARGHQVTAVVRDPAQHADLAGERVTLAAADAADPAAVAAAAATGGGHDAAIVATRPPLVDPPERSFADQTEALLTGLDRAGVGRVLVVGMAGTLEAEAGVRLLDTPDYRAEWLPFSRAHAAGLDALLAAETGLDWLAVSPPLVLDPDGPRTGGQRVAKSVTLPAGGGGRASYADFAAALLDEVERPVHHRTRVVVTGPPA